MMSSISMYKKAPENCCHTKPKSPEHPGKWMDLRHIYHLPRKLFFSCLGILFISIGIAVCRAGGVGVDAFTSMNIGFSGMLGMSLGTFQLIINAIILVAVFFLDKWQIGLGTIINMVAVGYVVDFMQVPMGFFPAPNGDWLFMGIYLVIGTMLFTLGVSMYLKTGMGVAPYDAIAPIASEKLHKSYTVCRVVQDVIVLIIAWFAGGPFGIFTLIAAFCSGPLITMWDKVASKPLYTRLHVLNQAETAAAFA